MARTKLSRGVKAFQLKSGNTTPYPFLGKLGRGIKSLVSKTPVGMAAKAIKGGGGSEGGLGDMNAKIDEIHSALVGEEGGDTMMTKRPGPLYHGDHPDMMEGPSLPGRKPSRHRHFKSNINQGTPGD